MYTVRYVNGLTGNLDSTIVHADVLAVFIESLLKFGFVISSVEL